MKSPTNDKRIISISRAIEYQSKLKKGVSIADLYKNFSTTLGDYGIERSYKTAEGTTYSASNQTLTWGHIGDPYTSDTFTLTYSLTLNGTSVKIVIKFHVTRIDEARRYKEKIFLSVEKK